ncbi:hypothetical protein DFH09DRAFT_1103743 [Mycena vulgaris]|nr:hypothetical protein DFH09DRAFT_1103743 [Mycena vulgaris]
MEGRRQKLRVTEQQVLIQLKEIDGKKACHVLGVPFIREDDRRCRDGSGRDKEALGYLEAGTLVVLAQVAYAGTQQPASQFKRTQRLRPPPPQSPRPPFESTDAAGVRAEIPHPYDDPSGSPPRAYGGTAPPCTRSERHFSLVMLPPPLSFSAPPPSTSSHSTSTAHPNSKPNSSTPNLTSSSHTASPSAHQHPHRHHAPGMHHSPSQSDSSYSSLDSMSSHGIGRGTRYSYSTSGSNNSNTSYASYNSTSASSALGTNKKKWWPPGGTKGWTSDTGKGCMLRTGQSLLATVLQRVGVSSMLFAPSLLPSVLSFVRPASSWPHWCDPHAVTSPSTFHQPTFPILHPPFTHALALQNRHSRQPRCRSSHQRRRPRTPPRARLLSLFLDAPAAPFGFGVHWMVLAGKAAGRDVGMWFGPNAAAGALRILVDAYPVCGLDVSVATDGTLYQKRCSRLYTRPPPSPLRNRTRERLRGIARRADTGSRRRKCRGPPRIAVTRDSAVYHETIKVYAVTFPLSVGIAGGRPSSSYSSARPAYTLKKMYRVWVNLLRISLNVPALNELCRALNVQCGRVLSIRVA